MEYTNFLNRFPREVGDNRKVVYNNEQFKREVVTQGRYKGVFTTLYSFDVVINIGHRLRPDYDMSARVNKVWWDLDDENKLSNTRKLIEYYSSNNILHTFTFSGGGFHIFAFMVENILNPKVSLVSYQNWLMKHLGLNINRKHVSMFGDLARIFRIPNTYNFKRKRWCIPLTKNDLSLPYEKICELAQKPKDEWTTFYGEKLLDLSSFDAPITIQHPTLLHTLYDVDDVSIINIDILPACVKTLIGRKKNTWVRENGWIERHFLITLCREFLGLTLVEAVANIREWLTQEEFNHCMSEVSSMQYGQVEYIYKRGNLFLPNRNRLEQMGICSQCQYCELIR